MSEWGAGRQAEDQVRRAERASRELPEQIARVKATVDVARAQLNSVVDRTSGPEPEGEDEA